MTGRPSWEALRGPFSSTANTFNHGAVSPALQIMNSKPPLLKPRSFLSVKERQESCLLCTECDSWHCLFVCVCVYTCACGNMCVHMCGGQMLIQLCWLASEARGSSCLRPPSGGVRDTTNLLGFLLRFWGSKLRSLCLHSRHVTDLVLSSAPQRAS